MRIEGRKSADGQFYELVQHGEVRQRVPIAEVHASAKFKRAIRVNRWEPV